MAGLDAVEDGDGAVGRTVVVAPHHGSVVGIGPDDGDGFPTGLEGEHPSLVLEEHQTLPGHVECQLAVGLGIHHRGRYLRPLHQLRVVHLAEVEASFKQPEHVLVHFGLVMSPRRTASGIVL